jgi:hypothetical protein
MTSGVDAPAGRRHWLERERVLLYPSLILLAFFVGVVGLLTVRALPGLVDTAGRPLGNDFIAFWSAARLAVEGRPAEAYDRAAIVAAHRVAVPLLKNIVVLWHYPPTFLLVVLPLGFLPYLPALGAFLTATVALWAALVRRMFADPRAWVVAAAFPAGLHNLGSGQNGFLTAGLAGFALLTLDRRPVLTGFLIGLLAIKPHLAVLFPLALVAEGRWRTFAVAAASALGFMGLSVVVFGWATMQAFLHDATTVPGMLDKRNLDWSLIPSAYVFALSVGLSPRFAMVLHGAVALVAAGCVWLAWRAADAPREAKLATLCAASLLVSPYIFFYDLVWTGLAIAWLVKLGMRRGFRPGEREFLAAAWLASGLVRIGYEWLGVQLGWVLPLGLMLAGMSSAMRPEPAGAGDQAGVAPAGVKGRGAWRQAPR